MGRSHVHPVQQPTDYTCGPAALKIALEIFGIKRSLSSLIKLCQTNRNGTTIKNLIRACNTLGFSVLAVEYATLRHIQSALHTNPNFTRAVLVDYLYDLDEKNRPQPESGHWATVSSYSASKSRIVLLDSATAKRKSYSWQDFRNRWQDYHLKRRKVGKRGKHFRLIRHWQTHLMLVLARKPSQLPVFSIPTQKRFIA